MRRRLFFSALPVVFIIIKIPDPIGIDKALHQLGQQLISKSLAIWYNSFLAEPPAPKVVVGLFDHSFKRISQQPPTLDDYSTIIERLSGFHAAVVVIDMDMRLDGNAAQVEQTPRFRQALDQARQAHVGVILPFLSSDDLQCQKEAERLGRLASHPVPCPTAALGSLLSPVGENEAGDELVLAAVRFEADNPSTYYPLYVSYDEDNQMFLPSLAMAAYLRFYAFPLQPGVMPGRRDLLRDDLFPAWRAPVSAGGFVFCSFPVIQLRLNIDIGAGGCPRGGKASTAEAQGNVPIQSLVAGKIVVIGQSGRHNTDWIDTPYGTQPGVMLHAAVIDNLLTFGRWRYPVNRDDVLYSFKGVDLQASEVYFFLCCYLIPLLVSLASYGIAKTRWLRPAGFWLDSHRRFVEPLLGLSLILAFTGSLGFLNALVPFAVMYLLIPLV